MHPHRILFLAFCLFVGSLMKAQTPTGRLEIAQLTDSIYVFTTYCKLSSGPFPSNGLYCLTRNGAVLIDTPWDTTQFQPLIDTIWNRHHQRIVATVSTHWHDDRTACTERFHQIGAATYATFQTRDLCIKNENEVPAEGILRDTTLRIGGLELETFYPGPGHTMDNIVVWLPKERILYGGCLVKSVEARGLGFTDDGDIPKWPMAIKALQKKYPGARWVIPGHQAWGGKQALRHTLKLLKQKPKSASKP